MEEEAALLAERDVELASAREAVRAPCVRYPTTTTHGNACAVGAHALVLNLVTESLDFSGDPQNHTTQARHRASVVIPRSGSASPRPCCSLLGHSSCSSLLPR